MPEQHGIDLALNDVKQNQRIEIIIMKVTNIVNDKFQIIIQ